MNRLLMPRGGFEILDLARVQPRAKKRTVTVNPESAQEPVPDPSANLAPQKGSGKPSPSSSPVGFAKLFGGVVLPLICFTISYPDRPDWQSGQPTAYAQLLLAQGIGAALSISAVLHDQHSPALCRAGEIPRECLGAIRRFQRGAGGGGVLGRLPGCARSTPISGQCWIFSALATFLPWGIWQFLGLLFGSSARGSSGVQARSCSLWRQ